MARKKFTTPEIDAAIAAVRTNGNFVANNYPILFPSGSTLLNLACSGTTRGWFAPGMIVNLVGSSNAGKSIGAMTSMAAIYEKYGDAYDYIDDDIENARNFDVAKLFGQKFADALQKPHYPYGQVATLERWYKNVMFALRSGRPCIYNTDSWDALKSAVAVKRMDALEDTGEGDEEVAAATYATEKARFASDYLPKLQSHFACSGSGLILISQTRDNMEKGAFKKKHTKSGGRAMKFFASVEVWLSVVETLGTDPKRPVGVRTRAIVERTRLTGKKRETAFPILYAYGIDDTTSMLQFLIEEKKVILGAAKKSKVQRREDDEEEKKVKKGSLKFKDDIPGVSDLELPRIEWLAAVERDKKALKALRKYVASVWHQIEARIEETWLGSRPPKFVS